MTTAPAATSGRATEGSARPRKFRPEVQALRALAVLLVLVYHIDPDVLPGGYIGVDVFFVISGFLITGHLWREASTTGTVDLKRFWAARARRILPASLATTVGVIAIALVLLPPSLVESWWKQALASVLYVENWALAAESVDYQAASNNPTAFQHFWSLGVEEQFYLVWPLLVLLAAGLWTGARGVVRAKNPAALRRILLAVFGLVAVASFAWGVQQSSGADPVAYYSTLTRVWELAAGGILALLIRDTRRFAPLRNTLVVFGVAAIVIAACLYDDSTPFPGVAALAPTLGACAVIAAGRTSGPGSLRSVTESWAAQRLGDISYSLYLWHFPVIVFFGIYAGRDPRFTDVMVLLIASFALAIASYTLIEQPVRTARWFKADVRMLVAALVAMVLVAGLAMTLPWRVQGTIEQWDSNALAAASEADESIPEGIARDFAPFVDGSTAISPNPIKAAEDKTPEIKACQAGQRATVTSMCEFGETENPKATVAVVGDSHAAMFSEPIITIATERDWRVVTYLHSACPFSAGPRSGDTPEVEACATANAGTRAELLELAPHLVITTYQESYTLAPRGGEKHAGAEGLAEVWNELADLGSQVVVLRDTPHAREDIIECVTENYADPTLCDQPREDAFRGRATVPAALELAPRVKSASFEDHFCDETSCPAVIGNVLVYRDPNHVTRTYMTQLTDRLREVLPASF
ncbi:acyltransferase family protein [Promicromonospora iranensis]|uniref:Peptidoglycan/LPS O-acetylase OafA/YrhL n=1 Tax=Promicromonospora iranensis TaxID=1105144 RepID=A0ABU2CRY2_9MICO|nr:acyltransferase family protein [Promicromonospora iranensis]MDR7384097.1 peptidoglycan/LPS O-acetylase OafA/YrhL [Promicromonospora iranensis]